MEVVAIFQLMTFLGLGMTFGLDRIVRLMQRRLARKLVLQLGCVMALIIGSMTWLVYLDTMEKLRASALNELREVADNRAREAGILFRVAQDSTYQLRDEYVRRLKAMRQQDPQVEFSRWFGKWPDGLTRVRQTLDDHTRLPSVYLRPGVMIDADVRRRTLAAFELLREWGPIMTGHFYSAYIDLPGEGLIMYSPSVNWGAEANPETNNFDYPPVQNAGPEKNSSRQNNWTEVYFDDKAKIYMVSTVTPVDLDGRWIAAASQDVSIQELLQRTHNSHLPGTYNLILSRDGRLIAHPQFEEKLKQGGGNLLVVDLKDELLADIQRSTKNVAGAAQVVQNSQATYSLGVAQIDGPDWLFVTVYPNTLMQQQAFGSARYVLVLGAFGLIILLVLVYGILDRNVRVPLKKLETAVDDLAQGRRHRTIDAERPDELGQLGRAFNYMVDELVSREDQLRENNVTLEYRVKERTAALAATNHELEDVIHRLEHTQAELISTEKRAALGALVAGVAHELNTPIGNAVLIGSTMKDHLTDFARDLDSGSLKRSVVEAYVAKNSSAAEVLLRSLQNAADLISSFKQVAVDRSGSARRLFTLDKVIHDIVTTLMFSVSRTGHTLEVSVPERIVMDSYPGAIGQLVTNFINNAVLHGFEGRTGGSMHLVALATDLDNVQISFSDSGVGIDEASLKRVFDPFFTTKLGKGGSGLGLHVVYTIVTDLLGGRIRLWSAPDFGTQIVIDLPLVAPKG